MLVPGAQSTQRAGKAVRRKMDSRLNGADLYVVRQAWKQGAKKMDIQLDTNPRDNTLPLGSNLPSVSDADSGPAPPLSLHDELRCKAPRPSMVENRRQVACEPPLVATSSRPCYRCISYMHWAGIRRVYWTNADGDWEGSKVRDLVDALGLENPSEDVPVNTGASLFVTKHEILMLRRQMGEQGGSMII